MCGDSLLVAPVNGGKLMVLSDGLGSGVKANILATLTTKIAMRLLERWSFPLEEVVVDLDRHSSGMQGKKDCVQHVYPARILLVTAAWDLALFRQISLPSSSSGAIQAN